MRAFGRVYAIANGEKKNLVSPPRNRMIYSKSELITNRFVCRESHYIDNTNIFLVNKTFGSGECASDFYVAQRTNDFV